MRLIKRTVSAFLAVLFLFSINVIQVSADTATDEVNIVFTSDLHSNVSSYNTIIDGQQIDNVGGFAKLKTFIDEKRNKSDILLVDCGDSVMGTMSHSLIDTEAFELSFFNEVGYDALVMGNHDFDFGAKPLGRWDTVSYEAKMMDSSIAEDETVLAQIEDLKHIIDEKVLSGYNLKADDIIAVNNDVFFEEAQDTLDEHKEMKLGNILSDSYRYVANTTPTAKDRPFDASVVPSGTIRDTITRGNITVADAFKCLSLGVGKDGNIGYPLVSVYLTGKEIRTIAEVDASISDFMTSARLYYSGVSTEFNPKRMILNKTVDVWRTPAICEDSYEELDDDKLYRIVTDSYSMSMLGAVTDLSKGILSVVPKDENGNPIKDPYDSIIYDENGNELKAWVAFAEYLQSFESNEEGISEIPAYYNDYHNRKVVNDSFTLRAMFKNTSKYFYIILTICLLIILLILFIVRVIVKKIHKKKVFKN